MKMKRTIAVITLILAFLAIPTINNTQPVKASGCTDACSSLVQQCILDTGGAPSCYDGYKDCMNYCSTLPDGRTRRK